jgi:hypothetical protein
VGQCKLDSLRLFADVAALPELCQQDESSNSASKMNPLGGGSEPSGQPQSSMALVMPQAQPLKPLDNRQAPATSCSIMDS